MDIISYRGPGEAGGVSSAIEEAWKLSDNKNSKWWYLGGNALEELTGLEKRKRFITLIPEELVSKHYAYCNNFLWPILHDLPQYAHYDDSERNAYEAFNHHVANYIAFEQKTSLHSTRECFVQDYQFAELARLLSNEGNRTMVFWHIPWPKNVSADHSAALSKICRSLLDTDLIGFHTQEYADNFMAFVEKYLPEFSLDKSSLSIFRSNTFDFEAAQITRSSRSYLLDNHAKPLPKNKKTQLLVKPLGVNVDYWLSIAQKSNSSTYDLEALKQPFIISVDRGDYTKSVIDRLHIIDQFFEQEPQWRGKISFLQICRQSRAGLPAFDKYWQECLELKARVNQRWQSNNWQPIQWIDQPVKPADLAILYKAAKAILVNPVRDGLNLTAKEYVVCQENCDPGVLLLSPGAGAWHELGEQALAACPTNQSQTIKSISDALEMSLAERSFRHKTMMAQLAQNDLTQWWADFLMLSKSLRRRAPQPVTAIKKQKRSVGA